MGLQYCKGCITKYCYPASSRDRMAMPHCNLSEWNEMGVRLKYGYGWERYVVGKEVKLVLGYYYVSCWKI